MIGINKIKTKKHCALTIWLLRHPRIGNTKLVKYCYAYGWTIFWFLHDIKTNLTKRRRKRERKRISKAIQTSRFPNQEDK